MTISSVRTQAWAFISNMFPSAEDASYGTFVRRCREDLVEAGFRIESDILIRGRRTGLNRLKAYAVHYARLAVLLLHPGIKHWYVNYASHHCVAPAIGAACLGKKIVVNVHGDDLALATDSAYRRVMSIGQGTLMRAARLIVVPSLYFKELTLQRFPELSPTRVIVSPSSGVDFAGLSASTIGRPCYWERPAKDRVAEFGYIGRIEADKGWESLFDAFLALSDAERARSRLHFWGPGHEVAKLQQRVTHEGQRRVLFHGTIPPSDLARAHVKFDFHVVPSQRESLGLAALEGLAAGHVLICSSIRPFTDFTNDGDSALHFDHRDPRGLAAALKRALHVPDETLKKIAANGQSVARAFDRGAVAADLARHIDEAFA